MKKIFFLTIAMLFSISCFSQDDCLFETYYRNPIDTSRFVSSGKPSILLFVHSKCGHGCPTLRMQKALEIDSCSIRKEFGIKLYVVYPSYSIKDFEDFNSYHPKNAEVLFWVNKPKAFYGFNDSTPYVLLFNGKGQSWDQTGGTYDEVINLIKTNIHDVSCPMCKGRCCYVSSRIDFWLDPKHGEKCSLCHGQGRISK